MRQRGQNRGRPRLRRRIAFNPNVRYFKPQGVPLYNLTSVELKEEELEALRLKDLEKLDQKECAQKMQVSTATLQRILYSAHEKVAQALIKGQAIEIVND